MWEFLNDVVQVPHCSLYDEGWHRIGCIGCPMSSAKHKRIENELYPHVKRNWIKAIKAIRNGGGIQKRICLVEHPQGQGAGLKRQRIAQDGGGYIRHPDPGHWMQPDSTNNRIGGRILGAAMPTFRICKQWMRTNSNWATSSKEHRNMESRGIGFSSSSSSDRLTEEQENEIAENIYDWWISGKSYKKWYAEKFQQMKFDFGED